MLAILDEVKDILEDRGNDYGNVHSSFERIAKMWSAYLGKQVLPRDVANMMILLKVSRDTKPKHDNMVDIIGYATLSDIL